jgi:hypothetical protein
LPVYVDITTTSNEALKTWENFFLFVRVEKRWMKIVRRGRHDTYIVFLAGPLNQFKFIFSSFVHCVFGWEFFSLPYARLSNARYKSCFFKILFRWWVLLRVHARAILTWIHSCCMAKGMDGKVAAQAITHFIYQVFCNHFHVFFYFFLWKLPSSCHAHK